MMDGGCSKVTDCSWAAPLKAELPIAIMEVGMVTLCTVVQFSNALAAISVIADDMTACEPQVSQLEQAEVGVLVGFFVGFTLGFAVGLRVDATSAKGTSANRTRNRKAALQPLHSTNPHHIIVQAPKLKESVAPLTLSSLFLQYLSLLFILHTTF
jgi:hypothetical protein